MRLLYGTTTLVKVTLGERFQGSLFRLFLAEEFNAERNPPSSNPFRIFLEFRDIVRTNDRKNPKYVAHVRGMKSSLRNRMKDDPCYRDALETVAAMGVHAVQPVLAILEADSYEGRGKAVRPVPPGRAGSPDSVEYYLEELRGPNHEAPELHLQRLYE